jgi:hypothetical protein
MKARLIGCDVLHRELCAASARSPLEVDLEFLPKALHDQGAKAMRVKLQERIDEASAAGYDVVLMGYALCGTGLAGLTARTVPVVIPRAHDCIGLLLGSHERYSEHFAANPGTYYRSTGWLERGKGIEPLMRDRTGAGATLDALIERYGEDNGQFLYEEMTRYQSAYRQLTYIRTGLEPDGRFEAEARAEAAARGWQYEGIDGSTAWIERLMAESWDEREFLILAPGWRSVARYDGRIIDKEPCEG